MKGLLAEKDKRDSRSYINGFVSHFLTGEDMADIEWEVNAVNSLLPGIGLKEVSSAVKDYFASNDCIVFLIAPQTEVQALPPAYRIKAIFRETEREKIKPRQNKSVSGELMEKPPSAGRIVSDEKDARTGAQILVLTNGAKVIFKETANKNNEIVLYAVAKGGTANWKREEAVSVSLVAEMVSVSGLGPYSRTELINKLAGKQISFSFWNSQFYRGLQGLSAANDLKTLFEMLNLFFTKPKFDERAIEAMLDQYRTNLMHQDEDPQRVFSRELAKTIYNSHPLYMPLEYDDIEKISSAKAFNYLSQCINPGDYTFVFTGNIKLEQIREYVSIYIASIPNAPPMNQWIDPGLSRPGKLEKTISKGIDDRSIVYLGWFSQAPSNFDEKKNQTAAVLSEYLDITLTNEIREKLGGVYSISAGASVSVIPNGEYSLSVYFQCNPSRADELTAAVQNHITDIINKPINIDTFNKSKEALLMQHEASIQRNLHIAQSYANSKGLYDMPLSRLDERPDVIRSVAPQDVQDFCRQALVSGPVKVVLYPESWE
jgi:zinc protease